MPSICLKKKKRATSVKHNKRGAIKQVMLYIFEEKAHWSDLFNFLYLFHFVHSDKKNEVLGFYDT